MITTGKTLKEIRKLKETLLNVETLDGKSAETMETDGRTVDVALKEVHYKNEGVKTLKGDFKYR